MEILKTRKIIYIILTILIITLISLLAIFLINKNHNGLTKITVALDWTPNTNHTGFFVAKEKGYFKEVGLEVEFVQPPEDTATSLVAANQADFGIDFQDSLAPAFEKDIPITVIAALVQHNTSGIISLKNKNITSPKEMEGKTYATWDLPIEQAIIKHAVEADGGNFNNVKKVPTYVTDVVTGLQTNIDSVWIFYGWDGIATKINNLDTNFFLFKDIDPVFDYYTPVIVANNSYLQENPEIAKKFLEACRKGYEYSIEHPEEAAEILLKEDPTLDRELVIESQKYMSSQYKSEVVKWGEISESRWNAFYKWLYDNKLINKEIEGRFTNEYLPE